MRSVSALAGRSCPAVRAFFSNEPPAPGRGQIPPDEWPGKTVRSMAPEAEHWSNRRVPGCSESGVLRRPWVVRLGRRTTHQKSQLLGSDFASVAASPAMATLSLPTRVVLRLPERSCETAMRTALSCVMSTARR